MNERYKLNAQLAQMLKGGVIMDVTTLEQARIAEAAGACAVMALEKIPADIRAAGGVATPADAALMMQLGAEGVFVGSGIFKSGDPAKRAHAIVKAVTNFNDAKMLAELSEDLGEAMVGINEPEIQLLMAERGK
ncbi:beta/alpha barrel domain-containing protein [Phascolarctobacterium succinatutens]